MLDLIVSPWKKTSTMLSKMFHETQKGENKDVNQVSGSALP